MTRPRVVCHMMTAVDGRVVVDGWPLTPEARREYERVHAQYAPDAWLCGRITMAAFAGSVRSDADVAREYDGNTPRADYVAPGAHPTFAIAVDPRGRLAWASAEIDGDHVVALLAGRVSDDYLVFLRERGVSYLFAGEREIDLGVALDKIGDQLGVRTLLLEGGGRINGGMLRAGLVDELSMLVAPVADGRAGTPALFDADDGAPSRLALVAVDRLANDVLWLRYRVEPTDPPARRE